MLETIIGIKAATWLASHWRMVAILAAIVLIAILAIVFGRGCNSRKAVLDEKLNQEVHEAIETKERKKMEDVFVKVELDQKAIDANVAYSNTATVNAIHEAKKKVEAMSDSELEAYLESLK